MRGATEDRTTAGPDRVLLLLTFLGLVARVLFLLLEPSCERVGDEPTWLAIGLRELGRPNRGLSPFRTRLLFYPPLYPYFIAVLTRIFRTVTAVLWVQVGLGTLPLSLPYRPWMDRAMADLVLAVLPITLDHAERQAGLPWHHRDPFDRLLVAQAQVEGVPLVSADETLDPYGISRIW